MSQVEIVLICHECNRTIKYYQDVSSLGDIQLPLGFTIRCPYCGADLDLGHDTIETRGNYQ